MQPALCPAELQSSLCLGCKGEHTSQWELCPHTCSCAQAPAQQHSSLTTPLTCPGPPLNHLEPTWEVVTAGNVPQGVMQPLVVL